MKEWPLCELKRPSHTTPYGQTTHTAWREEYFNSPPSLSRVQIDQVPTPSWLASDIMNLLPLPWNAVPFGVEYRGPERGETSGKGVLRLWGTSSRNSEFKFDHKQSFDRKTIIELKDPDKQREY